MYQIVFFIQKYLFATLPVAGFVAFIVDTLLWVREIELPILINLLVYMLLSACVNFWMNVFYEKI